MTLDTFGGLMFASPGEARRNIAATVSSLTDSDVNLREEIQQTDKDAALLY
jgi:hypothetical protein